MVGVYSWFCTLDSTIKIRQGTVPEVIEMGLRNLKERGGMILNCALAQLGRRPLAYRRVHD